MFSTIQRVQNYRWQKIDHTHRGRDIPLTENRNLVYDGRLTPRQRRRVIKKLLRQTKVFLAEKPVPVLVDGVKMRSPQDLIKKAEEEGLLVLPDECPTCQATGDSPCVTKSGNPAKKAHTNRPLAA